MQKIFSVFLTFFFLIKFCVHACTGIMLKTEDGSFVHGRTLEFGIKVDTFISVIPRNYTFKGEVEEGKTGLVYQSKFAALGVSAFNIPALMDGINEKGLAVGTFYFPGFANYTKIDSLNHSQALSPVDFPNWLLTQFATVDEVKTALSNVVIAPTIIEVWGKTPPPFHYIVYDKAGNCLVIEPIEEKLVLHENKLGVFTNSPTFEWHMTNLRNFVNLTPFDAKAISFNGMIFAPFGEGSGMVGIPGDFTPPSRFVRAAIYTMTALSIRNSQEAIIRLFHLLNQFDIPLGAIQLKEGKTIHSDSTLFTCVRDPEALKYYFKTYEDQTIKVVDLKNFDFDNDKIKSWSTRGDQTYIDVTDKLK